MVLLESFRRSAPKAKFLNVSCLVFTFLALVGCCVAFAGDLFSVTVRDAGVTTSRWWYYALYVQTDANRVDFNGLLCQEMDNAWCAPCTRGGRAFLAMQVCAFPVLLVLFAISVFRVAGGVAISALSHPAKSLKVEGYTTLAACALYFLSICIYGGTCYRSVQTAAGFSVHATGFAFLLCCFFLLVLQLLFLALIRVDPRAHLGWQAHAGQESLFADGADEEAARQEAIIENIHRTRRESLAQQERARRDSEAVSPRVVVGSVDESVGSYQSPHPHEEAEEQ